MDLIEATQQTCSGEPLLSLWLLSGVVPELRRELQDVAAGPTRQERQDVAQVRPGLDAVELTSRNEAVAMAFHSAPSSLPQKFQFARPTT